MKTSFLPFDCVKIFLCFVLHPYTNQNKIFSQTFRCAVGLWKSWVCNYSIRFQVIKLKLFREILKNEKFLLNIQTKCSNIANKILNAAIDAEQTFKCKWPNKKLLHQKNACIFCKCSFKAEDFLWLINKPISTSSTLTLLLMNIFIDVSMIHSNKAMWVLLVIFKCYSWFL